MGKEVVGYIKMQLKGSAASPGPPIAPILGSKGLSQHMMSFCKEFNDRTKDMAGKLLPVVITIYNDKTIDFVVKSELASESILRAVKATKGSSVPNQDKIGVLSKSDLERIAKEKMGDLNAYDVEHAMKIIAGTARSLGVDVEK